MNIENTAEGGSPLGFLNPVTRLVGIMVFSLVVAVVRSEQALGISLCLALFFVILSRLSLKVLLPRMVVFNLFIAFLWILVPWGFPGEEAIEIGSITISRQGISYMVALTLRSNALMLALMAFMASTPVISITHAMSSLKVPDKITYLFFMTYRYIDEISTEYIRLCNAMKVRCFSPATNIHTYRSYAYLVGMLLVNSFERAQRIRSAMLCRGFNGRFPRVDEEKVSWLDIFCLVMLGLLLAGIVYADR